jgi:hypothetical protein
LQPEVKQMRTRTIVAACLTFVVGSGAATRFAATTVDPITEWSLAASSAAAESGMAPLRTPITFAILHVAMFEAVTAATQITQPAQRSTGASPKASSFAAAVEAGYRVLLVEFPGRASQLETTYRTVLAAEPPSPEKEAGQKVGAAAATRLLASRADDGRNRTIAYAPGDETGAWVPTPPGMLPVTTAFLAQVTPFTMTSPSQFRPPGPPALTSRKWLDDYNEVKALGVREGSTRTPEQTATAWFWEPLAGTVWPATIRRLASEQKLDLVSSARFQSAAFAAFADSLIACWDAKFHYHFWRPVTAIHQGATDGHSLTDGDPAWEPLTVTPNFPEYPSGHACATAAVAHVIEDYFRHRVAIPARNVVNGEERVFTHAADVVDEVIDARMLLGLHFRSADEDGADIGRKIAQQIRRTWLRAPTVR